MIIPKEFMDVLDNDTGLAEVVRSTISRFEVVIQESKFEFFPEYTKHDFSHVEAVLANSKYLIGESLYLLNARDIAVLILSILAHDLGMHLTFEGFKRFLEKGEQELIKSIDNLTWMEEWNKYLQESKKWSGKKRQEIFGKKTLLLTKFQKDKNEYSESDRMFIGEFIRRHHPRMAHEIVLFGFPFAKRGYLPFTVDLEFEIRDIIGFISRSHGMDLRSTFSYLLQQHHDCRTPYTIKVMYLMVVLRLADYLHITPDRAPARRLQISSFSSPVSILEWKLHQTIKDVNQNHEDPETLFVNARPSNSVEFLKLETLLNNIQNEIDLSWAVMGEVYGRYTELNKLKISIRRIRSNLENKSYIDSLSFLPKQAIFNSDPEVIKLLVSPLYGGKSSYGVRELIQNSVDACRELEHLYKTRAGIGEYKSEIRIGVYQTDSDYYFQIEDNGIGMSAEVIIQYFFKAGASYRNNKDWILNFTVDGETQITRSGRFGVGVLAAFLLGDQLEVTTKNINSERGYSFTASLDDVQIEVSNTIKRSVGTTIRIKLNENSLLELKNQVESDYHSNRNEPAWFAWYVLNKPDIQYTFPNDWGREGFNKFHTAADINDWRVIRVHRFGKVLWKFENVISRRFYDPTLLCNGIIISNGYRSRYPFYHSYPSMSEMPSVAVLDYEGCMPLNLTRDKLDGDGELPFEKELSQSLILDMLAKLIMRKTNSTKLVSDTIYFKHPILRVDRIVDEDGQRVDCLLGEGSLVLSNAGYCLPYTRNIKKLKTNKIVQIWTKTSQELSFNIWSYLEYIILYNHPISDSNRTVKNELYELSFIHDFRIDSKRIYLPKQLGVALLNGEIEMRKDIWSKLKMEKELGNMVSIIMNNPPSETIDNSFFESEDGLKVDMLIEIYIAPKKFRKFKNHDKEKIEELNKYVEEVLDKCFADDVFIPYDLKERRSKYPQAFKYLSEYL